VKEFLAQSLLPLLVVCGLVSGATALFFDVPASPPPETHVAPAASGLTPVPVELSPNLRKQRLNELMARAAVTFAGDGVPTGPAPAASVVPGGVDLQSAASALAEAVRAARDARTETELLRAEDKLRAARLRMDGVCSAAGGPMCESAKQMRSMGF